MAGASMMETKLAGIIVCEISLYVAFPFLLVVIVGLLVLGVISRLVAGACPACETLDICCRELSFVECVGPACRLLSLILGLWL